ncbi:hypothetical protein SAZ11_39180 [Streptomyces sp. FXJ1.4098]|nr:hypothetical protein [Streptomyces sp. FXJ1.4098]
MTFTLASACAAGAAFTFVTGGLPDQGDNGPVSSAELVSWTGTPKALDTAEGKGSAAADQCLDLTAGQGTGTARISNADIRGDVASMVVTRSGDASYCLAGSDGTGFAMAISPVVKLPADGLDLDTYGARAAATASSTTWSGRWAPTCRRSSYATTGRPSGPRSRMAA